MADTSQISFGDDLFIYYLFSLIKTTVVSEGMNSVDL